MSKGNSPRFTRRVRKDFNKIKIRLQKRQNSLRNNGGKKFYLYKTQEVPNLNLMRLIVFIKMIRYF